MAIGIRSDHRSSKELSFPEWFAKSPGSRIDIYRVFTQKAKRERLRAKNPASFVYTINPQDGLVKKSGKIALKTLAYLTIIPMISVKAIDFFKGERRTIESDFQAKLEEMKSKIQKDQEGGIDLILVSAPLKKTKSGSMGTWACFDFKREQVILNWEVKVDWEVKPHHRQKSLAPIPEENQNYLYFYQNS